MDEWNSFCLKGKLNDGDLQLDSWFKVISEQIQPNNVEEFKQFDESDKEGHSTHKGFVFETTPEIPADYDIGGPVHADEVFIQNENDEPLGELLDGEFDNDFIDNDTSDVHYDDDKDNDLCMLVSEQEYVGSD